MNVRAILLIFALACACLFGHAGEDPGFTLNKWPVKVSKKGMPAPGTPEARAIEFLKVIRESGYQAAKSYLASDISKADVAAWEKYQAASGSSATLFSWHVFKVEDGLPVVSLTYTYEDGQKGVTSFKMKKEDGKWMVAGY